MTLIQGPLIAGEFLTDNENVKSSSVRLTQMWETFITSKEVNSKGWALLAVVLVVGFFIFPQWVEAVTLHDLSDSSAGSSVAGGRPSVGGRPLWQFGPWTYNPNFSNVSPSEDNFVPPWSEHLPEALKPLMDKTQDVVNSVPVTSGLRIAFVVRLIHSPAHVVNAFFVGWAAQWTLNKAAPAVAKFLFRGA